MKEKEALSSKGKDVSINWSEIKRSMEKMNETLEASTALSLKEKHRILRARALALSHEHDSKAMAQDLIEVIEFRLASETYAIEPAFVREIYPLKDFTQVPDTPEFVLGVINVRGQIVSVVNLKKFFNLPEKGLGELNKVIIVRNEGMEFGILADNILGIRQIPRSSIQASPHILTGIGADYLKGVTQDRVIILNAEKILGDGKIVVDEEALGS
jgi:purine-binding chemotaxis protein CheW